jgi:hypothetical protein
MLCYEDIHMPHESRNFTVISLAYFNSIMSCGIVLWGYSSDSKKVFCVQNKIFIIMADVERRVVVSIEQFQMTAYTQHKDSLQINLHVPTSNLSKYHRGVYCTGMKLFNNHPQTVRGFVMI